MSLTRTSKKAESAMVFGFMTGERAESAMVLGRVFVASVFRQNGTGNAEVG